MSKSSSRQNCEPASRHLLHGRGPAALGKFAPRAERRARGKTGRARCCGARWAIIRYSTARDRLRPGAEVRPRALAPASGRGASHSVDLLTSRAYTTVHHLVLLLSLPQAEAFHRRRKGSPPSRLENAAPPGGSDAGRRRARYVAENVPCCFEPVPVSPASAGAGRPGVWKASAEEFVRSHPSRPSAPSAPSAAQVNAPKRR